MRLIDVDERTAFKHKLEDKKIHVGDEVFVHGYVDEIRKDVVIIKNEGGYFGTAKEEAVDFVRCKDCIYHERKEEMTGVEFDECAFLERRVVPDVDNCCWGERKEE